MTTLDRAKAFVRNKALRTASAILLLAVAAVQAHAGLVPVTLTGSGGFAATGNELTLTTNPGANLLQLQEANGIVGLKFWGSSGSAVFTAPGVGTNMCLFCFGLSALGVEADNQIFNSDSFFTHFDFTVSDNNGDAINWFVSTTLGNSTGPRFGTLLGTVASGAEVNNGYSITGLTGSRLVDWSANLAVSFVGSWNTGDTITLTIPQNSFDLGSQAPSGVPEPGTWSLLMAGGATVAWLRRKRAGV
jgi:hypothetical protein